MGAKKKEKKKKKKKKKNMHGYRCFVSDSFLGSFCFLTYVMTDQHSCCFMFVLVVIVDEIKREFLCFYSSFEL